MHPFPPGKLLPLMGFLACTWGKATHGNRMWHRDMGSTQKKLTERFQSINGHASFCGATRSGQSWRNENQDQIIGKCPHHLATFLQKMLGASWWLRYVKSPVKIQFARLGKVSVISASC